MRMDSAQSAERPGMTLIELLVSLAVLAVISIAFATIMSQSQKVVDRSNALMRANATASAISQILRNDLACLAPQAPIVIGNMSNGPGGTLLFFAAGPFTSRTDPNTPPATANVARIDYGWSSGPDPDPNNHGDDFLWRRATLLTGTTAGTDANPYDDLDPNAWLGRYDPSAPAGIHIDLTVPGAVDPYLAEPNIPVQVEADNVRHIWPLLARPAGSFRVAWWSETTNDWMEPTGGTTLSAPPPAIRVKFSVWTDPKKGETLDYEVVCPIRQ